MIKNRLGFLTRSGIIAAVLTALIVAGVALAQGGMLFSPGGLNAFSGAPLNGVTSHAAIAGQCSLCHAPFWSSISMTDRCLTCHTDVTAQWQNLTTLHGILHQSNPDSTCRSCHPDHRGPNASVTVMDTSGFPHTRLGYSLASHQSKADDTSLACRDCHARNYIKFDQAVCATCHAQIDAAFTQTHTQDFGNTCLTCHDGLDTYGRNFNHNKASFLLIGKHGQVLCGQCHVNTRTIADLKLAPRDCNSCHAAQDAHEGRLGKDCGACHNPANWTPANMDHNLTTFKLEGRHADVACTSCHINNVFHGTPTDCNSCHKKDDPHNSQFGTTDCATCHSTAGWTPVTYDHNLSTFRLAGKHIDVACTGCHVNNIFRGTPTDCYSCHRSNDTHNGQFGTNCGNCHSTAGWTPATFDHNMFALTGGHAGLVCSQCHSGGVYSGLSSACISCHAEPVVHAGQFGTNCAQCHTTTNWNASINHPNACGEGGCTNHRGASCNDCHTVNNNYSIATCTKCHDSNSPHD
jgi:hypothetical protein